MLMKIKLKKKKTLIIIIVAVLVLIGAIASPSSEDAEETTKPSYESFEEDTVALSEENTTEKSCLSGIFNSKEDSTEKKTEAIKNTTNKANKPVSNVDKVSSSSLPVYKNSPYVVINNIVTLYFLFIIPGSCLHEKCNRNLYIDLVFSSFSKFT